VRAKRIPTGIQVFTQDSRSMLENKTLALQRLEAKVLSQQTQMLIEQQQDQWQEHNCLERGNPVKTFNDTLK
jgi:peptide chain release factor